MTERQSVLDTHMEILGRTAAKIVSGGLTSIDINASAASEFLDAEVDPLVFSHILRWMLDEGVIRASKTGTKMDGVLFVVGTQLTSKGIAIVKEPSQEGSIEKKIADAKSDPKLYQKIGDLIGSAVGSFTKSISGG